MLEHCAGLVELTLYLQGLLRSLMTILKNTILNSFTDADSEQITHEKKKLIKIKSDKQRVIIQKQYKAQERTSFLPRRTQNIKTLHEIKLSQRKLKQHYKINIPLMSMTKPEPGFSHPPGF